MEKFNVETGEVPIDNTLCVFKLRGESSLFIMGYLMEDKSNGFKVKKYGNKEVYNANLFDGYQYITNFNQGITYIKTTKK